MVSGVKSLPNGDYCAYCNAKVNISLYDFCPKCGSALSSNARLLKNQQEKRIKMDVLGELVDILEDEKSLNVILNKIKQL